MPNWPTQPWYPMLTRLLIQQPILLPKYKSNKRTSIGETTEADGLSLIWQSLSSKGISSKAQATILNSCDLEHKNNTCLNKWQSFANQWNADPLHPTLNEVLELLQALFHQGFSYSGINTERSTLSSFVAWEGNLSVGTLSSSQPTFV